MNYNEGFWVSERGADYQIQNLGISVIPTKPIPTRFQSVSGEKQAGKSTNQNHYMGFQEDYFQEIHGTSACPDLNFSVDQIRGDDSFEAAWRNRNYQPIYSEILMNSSSGWNNIPFPDLLTSAKATTNSRASSFTLTDRERNLPANKDFFSGSYSQINNNLQHQSASSNMLNSNCPSQIPHYGFPASHPPSYDLSSLSVYSGPISVGFEPATPNKGKRIENCHFEVANIGVEDQGNQVQKPQYEAIENTCLTEMNSYHLPPAMDSSSFVPSNPINESQQLDKTMEQDVELDTHETQRKQRRKKHRPKIAIEGKTKMSPRSKTPKKAENPAGKRKYVRRKGINSTANASIDQGKDKEDPTWEPAKSCKRSLAFDSEVQVRDIRNGINLNSQKELPSGNVESSTKYPWKFNLNSEKQAQNLFAGLNSVKHTNSSLQNIQDLNNSIVQNSPARIAFDLNETSTQMINEYLSLPDKQSKDSMVGSGKSTATGTENGYSHLPQQINAVGIESVTQTTGTAHSVPHSTLTSQNYSNCRTEVLLALEQVRGTKREYCNMVDRGNPNSMNLVGDLNSTPIYQEQNGAKENQTNSSKFSFFFPHIYKRKRTGKGQNAVTSGTLPSKTTQEDTGGQITMYRQSAPSGNDFATQVKKGQSALQFHNDIDTTETMNQGSIVSGHQNIHSLSIGHNFRLQNVCTDFLSHMETISGSAHDKLPSSGFMLNFGAARKITKARSKGLTRVRDLASLTAIMECKYSPTPAKTGKRSGRRQRTNGFGEPQASMKGLTFEFANMTKKRRSRRAPRLVKSVSYSLTNELHSYKNQVVVYDYRQSPVKIAGPSTVQKLYMDPIDEIVQKLNRLDMNSGSNRSTTQEKNALVPYKMVNAMIPYEGAFDYIKRRKPRAKVDLDPETDRVWKLLMGKECSEGLDGTEVDKEKWWEEERRVFQGRADSFIARMHLVQGDRRFTRWKGSVVDSVVGVFLTQNVSDHLSSSAFMSLAARFPLHSTSNREKTEVFVEEPEISIMDSYDSDQCYEKLSASDEGSITLQEPEHVEGKEVVDESFGSNVGSINLLNGSKGGQQLTFHRSEENANETEKQQCLLGKNNGAMDDIVSSQSSVVSTDSPNCSSTPQTTERYITVRENSYSAEANDRRAQEDVFSSQNSSVSSQTSDSSVHQTTGRLGSYSDSNSETEDTIIGSKSNNFNKPNFVNLLHMAVMPPKDTLLEHGNHELGGPLQRGSSIRSTESEFNGPTKGSISANADHFTYPSNVNLSQPEAQDIPSSNFDLHIEPGPIASEVDCLGESIEASTMPFLQTASKIVDANSSTKRSPALEMSIGAPSKPCKQPLHNSRLEDNHSLLEETPPPIGHEDSVGRGNNRMQKASSSLPDFPQGSITLKETMTLVELQKISENKTMESNLQEQVASAENAFSEITVGPVKAKGRPAKEKQEVFDWDSLRKDAHTNFGKSERNQNNMDTLDYDAVRCADVGDIASSIRGRGMNNMLAERIKDFLNRVVRDHGSIDLEWLRDVPPDKAKDYLLSIRGLGLKSVECVRLLTLYHHAFPVDTNVGRIAVRLGWVPLQPLPESLQLHLLELYPMMESIQKYLWPRLCKLTKEKLYELHYQMITFGKVFCTKSKPNCNACPMRAECRHFASAFASARLALPGPEEKRIVASNVNNAGDPQPAVDIEVPQLSLPAADTQSMQLRLPERNLLSETGYGANQSEPIIEQPSTPETNSIEVTQSDIEDAFYEDPDEIPTINLNVEDFTLTLQNYMQENNMELLGNDMSKALVALNPEVASIPTHKLKNVSRLRTEHLVYELPDSHPLLVGRDRREPDDPCSYLLAIWTPGETADSIQPPERGCRLQGSGNLCDDETCFSCNGIREANSQIVRGTLLIPCRTAMKGSFPLNGTYFQVNEVFADHDSSLCPIPVPRSSIWNLPRRTVSFGTSVPSIFKGLTTEAIQSCFWRGFVCVRGFDQKTRAPRPLQYRFHMVASKMVKKEQEQPTGKK